MRKFPQGDPLEFSNNSAWKSGGRGWLARWVADLATEPLWGHAVVTADSNTESESVSNFCPNYKISRVH